MWRSATERRTTSLKMSLEVSTEASRASAARRSRLASRSEEKNSLHGGIFGDTFSQRISMKIEARSLGRRLQTRHEAHQFIVAWRQQQLIHGSGRTYPIKHAVARRVVAFVGGCSRDARFIAGYFFECAFRCRMCGGWFLGNARFACEFRLLDNGHVRWVNTHDFATMHFDAHARSML